MSLESHLHGELLRTQWRLVELLEALPPNDALAPAKSDYEAQFEQAKARLPKLQPWPVLPQGKLKIYSNSTNSTRMFRVCQYLDSSDRLLDIGTNYGYFAGILVETVQPAAYTGIDLAQKYLDGVRQMAQVNSIDIDHWSLEVGDLYKLTPEWVAKQEPTMLLLLEVLEHLPDPQLALKTLADVLPDDAQLLFSVPMLGRLEACWGHHSLFDAERVRQLCADAGLYIHWVEPVVNVWKLVLVSRSPTPPARLSRLIENQLPTRAPITIEDPGFKVISLKQAAVATGKGRIDTDAGRGIQLLAKAGRFARSAQRSGIVLPVEGLRALRLELEGTDTTAVSVVTVEGRDAQGNPTCRWEFTPTKQKPIPRSPATYVFRPGQAAAGYHPRWSDNAEDTRTVEISVRLDRGGKASMSLRRAAYVR